MNDDDGRPRIDFMRDLGRSVDISLSKFAQRVERGERSARDATIGRRLTVGEIAEIGRTFGTTHGFGHARVIARNFWFPYPFDRAMTPTGDIFFPNADYEEDYSAPYVSAKRRALFMHEATHLYQWYVLKQWVIVRGFVDRNYSYSLASGKRLKDYPVEQMGQIVEDYYLVRYGLRPMFNLPYKLNDYRDVLPVRN